MSVLIKGAEKPDHCLLCFAFRNGICAVAKKEVILSKGVQEWCPLVEIPPHGRLIDADKVMSNANYDLTILESLKAPKMPTYDRHELLNRIDTLRGYLHRLVDAPTVIESEE